MEYRKLGNTGLDVSVIGLGTNNFGPRLDLQETTAVLDAALEEGINFLDTANAYGGGTSEEFIGEVFAKNGRRHDVIIATKVGLDVGGVAPSAPPSGPNKRGSSRQHIMDEVENSLRRLQTDYIDVFYMHMWDKNTPIEETLRALDDLVHQGKVRYIGSSNYSAWQLTESVWTSKANNLFSYACVQPEYSLVVRNVEHELIPFCERYGMGLIPYFPLASGLLTGKYKRDEPLPEGTRMADGLRSELYRNRYLTDKNWELLGKLEGFAAEREHAVTDLAFAYLLASPVVPSVIAGATKPEQVHANAKSAEWRLTDDDVAAVRQLF
ncbi:MAG: aldo/keto reductase [SAR202 cluster bacterium]|nr:aldo/keto reductase [SAR202 cluster bacterium]|tara:strand:- start:2936 stop:3907 length:972 start_codon:yes stop_codon:yes gene_type:complete